MARAIAVGAVASPTNPLIDLWTVVAGALADVFSLTVEIFDLSTGTPVSVSGPTSVDVGGAAHLGTGHYAATWTAAGNLGLHRARWVATFASGGPTSTFLGDFDVLAAGLSLKGPAYCLLSDLRAEGFTSTMLSDLRALALIRKVSLFVERWTRRFFEPRYRSITLDGSRGVTQYVEDPIIALASVSVDGTSVDPTSYKVYNRHIAEGLTNPDDRDDAHVTFDGVSHSLQRVDAGGYFYPSRSIFWPGPRDVALSGLFGYTDPDPDVPAGVTPEMIKHVTILLVAREMTPLAKTEDRQDAQSGYRVRSIRTRDQSIDFGPGRSDLVSGGGGEFTGDPAIDDIIASFVAPPFIGGT